MSTNPIRVQIRADDQYSAALSTAESRVRSFGATSGLAGTQMTRGFFEARGAAYLLGEEVGVKLNRHLRGVLATSELLGPLLSAAFPIAAAVGFIEIAKGIYDRLAGIREQEEQIAHQVGLAESFHKVAEEVAKINQGIANIGKTQIEITRQAMEETRFRLISAQLLKQQQEAMARSINQMASKGRSPLAGGVTEVQTGIPGTKSAVDADIAMVGALSDQAKMSENNLALLAAEFQKASAEFAKAVGEAAEKSAKTLDAAAKRFDDVMFRIRQEKTKAAPRISGVGDKRIASPDDLLNQAPQEAVADRYLARFKALQSVYLATRTPAEMLAIEIAKLNQLFGDNRGEIYQRAIEGIKDKYDETRQAVRRFGAAIGDALRAGLLMGESWNNVLKTLIITLGEIILKMYALKALQSSSFGKSGFGGFLSEVIGRLATGGPAYAGMPYLVGEQGPEIFMPNTSGSIVPNSSLGGATFNYVIHAEGAEIGVERKILAAMQIAENRAVARSVGIARENRLRGRD